MAASQRIDSMRIRVFQFVPEGDGTFVDVLTDDFSGTYAEFRSHMAEILDNLPAHHFAIVCDALPNAAITLGYEQASTAVGTSESESGSGMDSTPQGLARTQKATGRNRGPRRQPPSWAVAHDSGHEEIPADIQTGTGT